MNIENIDVIMNLMHFAPTATESNKFVCGSDTNWLNYKMVYDDKSFSKMGR